MNKKIAITGANGTIGTVLRYGLKDVVITSLVRPKIDVRNFQQVVDAVAGVDVIIHLAWDTKTDNYSTTRYNNENTLMTYNVYQAALAQKIPRVIMASSVHADRFANWNSQKPLTVEKIPTPDSPYGAEKVFMEALGRYYATEGLEVACIRFGAVNAQNMPNKTNLSEMRVYFSHNDCCRLVKSLIDVPVIPNNFVLLYGVSDNINRIHDLSNPLGWMPLDGVKHTELNENSVTL